MPYRFAILGHPLGHSLSPTFHTAALQVCGFEGTYGRAEVSSADLFNVWSETLSKEYDGFNVTIPHKVDIIPFLNDLSDGARTIGAVNVLVRRGEAWTGHNTDVAGIEQSLSPFRERIAGRSAVIIGAGGAARAALAALVSGFGRPRIVILNRSPERAEMLATEWKSRGVDVSAASTTGQDLQNILQASGLIIQATSAGMHPKADESPLASMSGFHPDQIVLDMIYRPRETRFLRDARAAGATVIEGLEMFLHQAVASFALWTGVTPPLDRIRPIVEKELSTT